MQVAVGTSRYCHSAHATNTQADWSAFGANPTSHFVQTPSNPANPGGQDTQTRRSGSGSVPWRQPKHRPLAPMWPTAQAEHWVRLDAGTGASTAPHSVQDMPSGLILPGLQSSQDVRGAVGCEPGMQRSHWPSTPAKPARHSEHVVFSSNWLWSHDPDCESDQEVERESAVSLQSEHVEALEDGLGYRPLAQSEHSPPIPAWLIGHAAQPLRLFTTSSPSRQEAHIGIPNER